MDVFNDFISFVSFFTAAASTDAAAALGVPDNGEGESDDGAAKFGSMSFTTLNRSS